MKLVTPVLSWGPLHHWRILEYALILEDEGDAESERGVTDLREDGSGNFPLPPAAI